MPGTDGQPFAPGTSADDVAQAAARARDAVERNGQGPRLPGEPPQFRPEGFDVNRDGRTVANTPERCQDWWHRQAQRGFRNPHPRPGSATDNPELFVIADTIGLSLEGAMAHEWQVLYVVVSYTYDLLVRLFAAIYDVPTLESAITLFDIYMLQSLRVDGLTLRVSAGPAVSNAAMASAIDPHVSGIQNPIMRAAYLQAKAAADKAALRAAALGGGGRGRNGRGENDGGRGDKDRRGRGDRDPGTNPRGDGGKGKGGGRDKSDKSDKDKDG